MARPKLEDIPSFYHNYVNKVTEDEVVEALKNNTKEAIELLNGIDDNKWDHRYAEGKWSIKELVQHINDAERIFCYRALTFARRDNTPLPGFEENDYALHSKANTKDKNFLVKEFEVVRNASLALFTGLDEEQLLSVGTANGNKISVLAIGFIMAGHVKHHLDILKERYL
jgi:uncharacterized damage-inducible protein DinB